jgi:hypothetical protein
MPPFISKAAEPTSGCEFYDLRKSPMKLIEVVDNPAFNWQYGENGTIVHVGSPSTGKVYGPYRLDSEFARGNGKIVFKAYSLGRTANQKPMSKEELIQQNADLLARLAALEAKM